MPTDFKTGTYIERPEIVNIGQSNCAYFIIALELKMNERNDATNIFRLGHRTTHREVTSLFTHSCPARGPALTRRFQRYVISFRFRWETASHVTLQVY